MSRLILNLVYCSFFLSIFLNANISKANSCLLDFPDVKTLISTDQYLEIINSLIDHINGDIILSDNDFIANHDILIQHMGVLSSDLESVSKSFDLVELFEQNIGALFTTPNTRNGFNRAYASDGLNLHRNIMLIQQGLMDHCYNEEWLIFDPNLLDGKLFRTSEYFPGSVDGPENPEAIEIATIRCAYLLASGSQPWADIGNSNVVRPTGCYLAPGGIGEVIVPEALIGKGVKIRVGAHFWDLQNKSKYKRLDRVSVVYDVNEISTKIANPLGGGVYIEIPLGVDEGVLDILLKNVVRSPFFSMKTFHETSLSEWQDVERNHQAPWTDFETDKFMMQVPTSWIYAFDDPKSLLEDWDKSMDAVSDLLGRPRVVDRHKNYLQFDVIIRGSAYHPGYPMSNTPYDPNADANGLPNHNILKGPQFGQDIHFHELGHEVAITKFVGETEAIVNFLYVPVLNRCFGYSLAEAFQKSFGPSYNYTSTKDNTTRTRLVADTFHKGEARNTCSCTKNEVRYQHRGYAHYVDIVELFGWEALERFWQSESDAADMGMPFPVNNQEQDDRIFRMSKAAGVDLRPLFHFWGIHPADQEALAQLMDEHDLKLPMSIKKKLHQYRELIPANYDEFVLFGNELNPDFLNYSGTQFDFGAGWYQVTAETYDEAKASKIEEALSDIIVYYYGTDCFDVSEFVSPVFSFQNQFCVSDEAINLDINSDNGISGMWFPQEINTSVAGLFELTYCPDLDQCSDELSLEIEVYEPSVTVGGDTQFCDGESSVLYADSEFANYLWVLDGQEIGSEESVEVSESGLVQLVVTDLNGCEGTLDVQITEYDPIVVELVDGEVLISGGTAPYQVTIEEVGDVQIVTVIDANNCQTVAEFMISQVDDVLFDDFKVLPNPASDILIFEMSDHMPEIQSLQLYSLDGQLINQFEMSEHLIDVSHLNQGVYLLQLKLETGVHLNSRVLISR